MIYWFFFTALLMTTGQTAFTVPQIFTSEQECHATGEAFAAHIQADPTVKQAMWMCTEVDFDRDDPLPPPPALAPSRGA